MSEWDVSGSHKQELPNYSQDDEITFSSEKIEESPPADVPTNVDAGKRWRFMLCNNFFNSDLKVFVSANSVEKYKSFKNSSSAQAVQYDRELQSQGIGIPLIRADVHDFHAHKFLTIKRYYVDKEKIGSRGFDSKKDLHDFCIVRKHRHGSYSTYELKFSPDPNDISQDFTIVLFKHGVLPIADYVYRGSRYRWIYETRSYESPYCYSNYLLSPGQHSMTDNWDKETNKLEKSLDPNNPLIGDYMSKAFSLKSRNTKKEYYSPMQLASLDENKNYDPFSRFRQKAVFTMRDMNNTSDHPTVDHESIYSVNLDALTSLCIALVFKRREDIKEEARKILEN
ncbi:hypothetical protein PICST_29838 [Scheffersomyces stipitis CBS 6054]|uniref:Uncharacterized protein n=1 Tax=Scheffersomyces stipitis (strain ATCC 58785 / CBS 6054 / NBRC 10063 / NRRL Y-11545) TaxID=322104 RepID=A3LP65_PICST|nr:hypothetical protein PICST_29838 [Scheffersomyces stipitis CBS 6054]ABN64989.2 hypothetical protein PICST_29838 [Scheffersomyces stipitis CBS 6054]KAG2735937.1 hypothetical protein G9P44_000027 [Scheffersomyces stipitis]